MSIPVSNLFYLLAYAWNQLDEASVVHSSLAGAHDLQELLARVLISGTTHLLRRGLDRGYEQRDDAYAGLRGRLNVSRTVSENLLSKAHTRCSFDELSYDVLHNRILRSTVRRMLAVSNLPSIFRDDLGLIYRKLEGIKTFPVTAGAFRAVQLHRNTRFYSFLMNVCELIHEESMIDEQTGSLLFRDFVRDEVKMRGLFQRFVFEFLRKEQSVYSVSSPQIPWQYAEASPSDRAFLPRMQTDVVLRSARHALVIDTKFTPKPFQTHFNKQTIRSSHLYQMFTYLSNSYFETRTDGLLLYPQAGSGFCMDYQLGQHGLRVASIDLGGPWPMIHDQLIKVVMTPLSLALSPRRTREWAGLLE